MITWLADLKSTVLVTRSKMWNFIWINSNELWLPKTTQWGEDDGALQEFIWLFQVDFPKEANSDPRLPILPLMADLTKRYKLSMFVDIMSLKIGSKFNLI